MNQKVRKEEEDKKEIEKRKGPSERVFIRSQNLYNKQKKDEAKTINFINSENFVKIDYSLLNPVKEKQNEIMKGFYSKKRADIVYINPKVNEPYELIEGRPPRKVMIDRMKKVYATIKIETLLKKVNIDYSTKDKLESWLPIEFFEDKDLDIYTPNEWIKKATTKVVEEEKVLFIPGVGLYRNEDGVGSWRKVLINSYNYKTEKYEGIWEGSNLPCCLSKIYLLFEAENPYLFCKKVSLAHQEREKAESIIRYNFYIDKMVCENLPDLSEDQKNRLRKGIEKSTFFKNIDTSNKLPEELVRDLNINYLRTTNKIIFDKFFFEKEGQNLIISDLRITPPEAKMIRFLGLESIANYNYIDNFKNFTFKTLLCRKEIVDCLTKIKDECNKIKDNNHVFNLNIKKPLRLQEFKQNQRTSIIQITKKLKNDWLKNLKETLLKSLTNVGKGSFNLNVCSKEIYEYLKLKKYMTVVKLLMQDTLNTLVSKSVTGYVDFIESFIPSQVIVEEVNNVVNIYPPSKEADKLDYTYDFINYDGNKDYERYNYDDSDFIIAPTDNWPLFQVNITKKEDKRVEFTTKPEELLEEILKIFDEGLEQMQKIPQVEPELLPNLIKKAEDQTIPLKSIVRSKSDTKPIATSPGKIIEGCELNDDTIWIWELYDRLKRSLIKATDPLKIYLEKFKKYKEDLLFEPNEYMKKIAKSSDDKSDLWTSQKIREDIIKNREYEKKLLRDIPEIIHVSFFQINCKEFRTDLASKYAKTAELEIEFLKNSANEKNKTILNIYHTMKNEITTEIITIADLIKVKNYIQDTVPTELVRTEELTQEVNEIYGILDQFNVVLDTIQFKYKIDLISGPTEIKNTIMGVNVILDRKKEILYVEQLENQTRLDEDIDTLVSNVTAFNSYINEDKGDEPFNLAHYVQNNLELVLHKANMYNEREDLFGKVRTNYNRIHELKGQFEPFYLLWTSIETWKKRYDSWFNDNFSKLNGVEVEETTLELQRNLKKSLSKLKERDVATPIIILAEKYKDIIEKFVPIGDLAVALTKRGLTDRHWKELFEKTGIDCTPKEGFTFKIIVDKGMQKYIEICSEVGEKAYREYNINEQLETIEKKWKDINFVLALNKNTKVFTISNWNEINKELDTDIMEVQQLEISPYKGPFEKRISDWGKELLNVSNVLEEWNKCQKTWIYLQPVFDSGDIAKDIPNESKKFGMTDRMWRELMSNVEKMLTVKINCNREGLLEKLREANMNLENVEKGLNNYMEKKRGVFPRFYFISNPQFLEILSQTKDIKKVKNNLNKIFESIENIDLRDDKYITNFISKLNESLILEEQILIQGRNVEIWMLALENMMFKTIRAYLERALKDYPTKERKDWVSLHPGQVIMCGNQTFWTQEVEVALLNNDLKNFLDKYQKKIEDIVILVREKLTRLMSINLSNLITIDIHNRTIIKNLISNNITDINSFEWIMQLRYYWMFDIQTNMDQSIIKSVQTDFPYGYEYMGNGEILVITPLTDKCFLTLMGAICMNLGGAPAGPAGTGKTESTKDLARSLAKQCIVYNCSKDTDYVMLGKFFKGLACCGAWICFDEFNRINIEVLSVIAQQLLHLFGAKDKGKTETNFEGSDIKILPTFCVFITMNPGYAGRTELPDNLKALFRPIAMMVPDYRLISEINLYSAGYVMAEDLAMKVVSTMKLSSEQLSTQGHYDFGMRAVKSVLNAARRLKRMETDKAEDQLLLRALEDVNVPKFIKEDIPLFVNIISDLFPETERPKIDNKSLLEKLNQACINNNIELKQMFEAKIIQLYDTLQVRHGLMIVGPAGGGKTMNYTVLKEAITALSAEDERFLKTESFIMNPKAIRQEELYCEQDPNTLEWSLGCLPLIINECKRESTLKTKFWIIFDGPVDAVWIEDMNSVLDDSKKLCLSSSDIIMLNEMITMIFEVEDLRVASPATVSRCGMVFMEPSALGLEPLVNCWLKTLPETFAKEPDCKIEQKLRKLFDLYLNEVVYFVRKRLKEPCPSVDNNLAQSVMRIIDCYFDKFKTQEAKYKKMTEEVKQIEGIIEGIFNYAMIWALGVTTNEEGRKKFDQFLRESMKKKCLEKRFLVPEEGTVYEFLFDVDKGSWIPWTNTIPNYDVPNGSSYTDIIVPTIDSIRNSYIIRLLLKSNKHVITSGPTGTGKTVNIMDLISKSLGEKFISIIINFSAQTTARQTQDNLEGKVKKKSRNKYAPENNKVGCIFVDDLNMPIQEDSGAQPPIELLRQWLDHQGWYELKNKTFIYIENLVLVGAMGPSGGGRSFLSQRFQRHFNLLTYTELEDKNIKTIFNTIIKFFLFTFKDEIKDSVEEIVNSTLKLYKDIKVSMLPTPKKMHYLFNLRDMSKVLQGVSSASKNHVTKKIEIIRLWIHEMQRVFGDRLINEEDRNWLKTKLDDEISNTFGLTVDATYNTGKKIIFCDFSNGTEASQRPYIQVVDVESFKKKIEIELENYNSDGKKKPLKLVMFLDACDHVSRISRVLRQPQGNALLLGVGGSGRQSLARLATYINKYECYQIEVIKGYSVVEFLKNVKECLKQTGINQLPTTFLIADTQLVHKIMLEYINNVLNSGDIPNLYKPDDYETIRDKCKSDCQLKFGTLSETNLFKTYLSRVIRNLHIVLAMSPVGDNFIQRLRMFPSLVNLCTIDWFTEWPEDALESVANDALTQNDMELGEHFAGCVSAFKFIHKRVEKMSVIFSQELRRYIYLTPTSYLELLSIYQTILKEKRKEINKKIERLVNGLKVLDSAGESVKNMQEIIRETKPKLLIKSEQTQILVKDLIVKKSKAEIDQALANEKSISATKKDNECTELLNKAQTELDKVQPLIFQALAAVKSIDKNDLDQIKNFKVLNLSVEPVMEALLIFQLGPTAWKTKEFRIPDGQGKNPYNIKEALMKKMGFSDTELFKEGLANICASKESLNSIKTPEKVEHLTKCKEFIQEKNITEESAKRGSAAAIGIFNFMVLLIKYVENSIAIIDPLSKLVIEATGQKDEAIEEKRVAVETADIATRTVEELTKNHEAAKAEEEKLKNELSEAEEKLERANVLITLLSGEKTRWEEQVRSLRLDYSNLIGDCLIAAGSVSYSGPFTFKYRQTLENDWRVNIKNLNIVHTNEITMQKALRDDILVREWTVNGLQQDDLSIENGIMIYYTRRWPLLIDPQNQGNTFIKKYGKKKGILDVVKASDPSFMNIIINNGIRNGKWILLENVGVNLDPALEPILLQQKKEKAGNIEMKIGDAIIPYNKEFKLFLSTTIPNPHYSPETFVKVTIINFGITLNGLEEQMMTLLINNEMPELEQRKNAILIENFSSMQDLKKTEDLILNELSKSEGKIEVFLMDNRLITILKEAKTKSEEIKQKIDESEKTSKEITIKREIYRRAAYRASLLFFCTIDLSSIDPMYQFSLQWFSKLYEGSIKITPGSSTTNPDKRINDLNKTFTKILFDNVCRSLFEKDKLLFSFTITHRLLTGEMGETKVKGTEWRYLLAGPSGDIIIKNNPTDWINKNEWGYIYRQLKFMNDNFAELDGIEDYFFKHHEKFKIIYDSSNPNKCPLPDQWESISEFLKLCILKMIRPDKLIAGLQEWIENNIGKDFVEPPSFNLLKSYKESSNIIPLIFILSPGSDPINEIRQFAEDQGKAKSFDYVSLGRGQERKAIERLEDMRSKGGWVLLQNCHLAESFMSKLEEIVENFDTNWPDKDFRLWLTSMTTDKFPVSVLQCSVKITIEPPKGLKNNLLRTYNKLENKDLDDCDKKEYYRGFLFALSFFHAIVQDRRKYGPIGWNVKYDFTTEDWTTSKKQIKIFLERYEIVPYKVLEYLIADINYGGRVTDDKDQRLIKSILKTFLTPNIFNYDKYKFSKSGLYYNPEISEQEGYLNYIMNLPVNTEPEIFGLHENADIITAQNECYLLLETILSIQPRLTTSGGKTQEQILMELLGEIEKKVPAVFDKEEIFKKYPTDYNESMNTVLYQEIIRYNKLLAIMKKSIKTLKKALVGKIVMSEDTEKMARSLSVNQVPLAWSDVFLSLKPLSSWTLDLSERISFLQNWIDKGTPKIFWISGFSFPQAFLTASLQNFARKYKKAIDLLNFEFNIKDSIKYNEIKEKPEDGVYVYGMFLEGSRWNYQTHLLDDSLAKELYTDVPVIHFLPVYKREIPNDGIFYCPLYKVLSRTGTLSTTGHSTNYVLMLELPSDRDQAIWIRAGVAMFLSLKQ